MNAMWILTSLAMLLPPAASAEDAYYFQVYGLKPGMFLNVNGISDATSMVDLGAAITGGQLRLNDQPLHLQNDRLLAGDTPLSMLAAYEYYLFVQRDHGTEDLRIPFDEIVGEYLVPLGDGTYEAHQLDAWIGMNLTVEWVASKQLQLAVDQTTIVGREPLPDTQLDVGKPIIQRKRGFVHLVAHTRGDFVAFIDFQEVPGSEVRTCIVMFCPSPDNNLSASTES